MRKTTLAVVLASVGLLSAAALAAGPGGGPGTGHVRAGKCGARTLQLTPSRSTVERLSALRKPARKAKRRVYKVSADLVSGASTRSATKLVVSARSNPSRTMLLVASGAGCAKGTPVGRAARRTRSGVEKACGALPRSFTPLTGRVTVTGIGFFASSKSAPGAPNGIEMRPVLRFRASGCRRQEASAQAPGPPPFVTGSSQAPVRGPGPRPEPEPEPQPEPAPEPACTTTLSPGGIEDEANRSANRVLCLVTGYYQESGDALIVIDEDNVRVQAAPGAYPIVCGRFVLRGTGSTIAPDVDVDPACAPYFNESSPWNRVAGQYSASVPIPAAWLPDFDGSTGTQPLVMSRGWEHGKAIFKADRSDAATATFRIADASQCFNDPAGCESWQPADPTHRVADESSPDPDRIPIPSGVRCPGLPLVDNDHDRALTVVSADGKTAWELWHCTHAATPEEPWYTAAVAVKWSLDADDPSSASRGFQDAGLGSVGSTSARGSGTPLVTTTVTPRDAVRGIHHPLGLTVVNISSQYVNPPASHTDGCPTCGSLRYGMLFVLDPAFKPARQPRLGDLNVIEALKRYGAYVVDQGTVFEIDGSPNEPTAPPMSDMLWNASGIDLARLGIKPSDLRYVPTPGAPLP